MVFYTFFYLRCAGSTLFFRVDLLRAKKVKVTGNSFFLLVRSTQFEILLTNFLSSYLQCDELFCSCILQEVHEHAQERRLHWRRLKMPTHQVHSHRLVKKQQKKPFQEDVPSIFFSFKLTATEDDDYIKTTKNNLFVTDNLPPLPSDGIFFFSFSDGRDFFFNYFEFNLSTHTHSLLYRRSDGSFFLMLHSSHQRTHEHTVIDYLRLLLVSAAIIFLLKLQFHTSDWTPAPSSHIHII